MSSLANTQDGLLALAAALTGLDVVWEDQPRPATSDVSRGIVLLSFTATASVGRDEVRTTFDTGSQDFGDTAVGQRMLPWRIKVDSLEQGNADTAWNILEKMRLRLRWQSSIDALNALNVSIATTGQVQDLQVPVDDRVISRAALDVMLNASFSEADPTRYPYIAEITGTLQLLPGAEKPLDIVIP
jgi:hypothetical protein